MQVIPIRTLTQYEAEVGRVLQICNACRYCEVSVPCSRNDATAGVRQGRHPLPRQPVP